VFAGFEPADCIRLREPIGIRARQRSGSGDRYRDNCGFTLQNELLDNTKAQRHKGAGAIEDDSGTDNEIKKRISMSVPDCSGPLCVSVSLCSYALDPFRGRNFETFDSSWNNFFSVSVSSLGRTIFSRAK